MSLLLQLHDGDTGATFLLGRRPEPGHMLRGMSNKIYTKIGIVLLSGLATQRAILIASASSTSFAYCLLGG